MRYLGIPTTRRAHSLGMIRHVLYRIHRYLFRGLSPFVCFFCCPHASTAAVPRGLQRLIDSNPRMITTGLPLLRVKEEEQSTASYSLSRSASLSDTSSRAGRVSTVRSGSSSSYTSIRALSVSAPAVRVISCGANIGFPEGETSNREFNKYMSRWSTPPPPLNLSRAWFQTPDTAFFNVLPYTDSREV